MRFLAPCSASTMLLYPVQSGTMHAACLHARRKELMAAAGALCACCDATAACLERNRPIADALRVCAGCADWRVPAGPAQACTRRCNIDTARSVGQRGLEGGAVHAVHAVHAVLMVLPTQRAGAGGGALRLPAVCPRRRQPARGAAGPAGGPDPQHPPLPALQHRSAGEAAGGRQPGEERWSLEDSRHFGAWVEDRPAALLAARLPACLPAWLCSCYSAGSRVACSASNGHMMDMHSWAPLRPSTTSVHPLLACSCASCSECCRPRWHGISRTRRLRRRPALTGCPAGTSLFWQTWSRRQEHAPSCLDASQRSLAELAAKRLGKKTAGKVTASPATGQPDGWALAPWQAWLPTPRSRAPLLPAGARPQRTVCAAQLPAGQQWRPGGQPLWPAGRPASERGPHVRLACVRMRQACVASSFTGRRVCCAAQCFDLQQARNPTALAPAADSSKEQLLARLSQRDVARAQHMPTPQRFARRAPAVLRCATSGYRVALVSLSVKPQQVQLACQMLVCYLAVMFLEIAASSYLALEGRPVWAVSAAAAGDRANRFLGLAATSACRTAAVHARPAASQQTA